MPAISMCIPRPQELLKKSLAMSLSDQYWLCPKGQSQTVKKPIFMLRKGLGNEAFPEWNPPCQWLANSGVAAIRQSGLCNEIFRQDSYMDERRGEKLCRAIMVRAETLLEIAHGISQNQQNVNKIKLL